MRSTRLLARWRYVGGCVFGSTRAQRSKKRGSYHLTLPHRSASCSSASGTYRWPSGLWARRIQEDDHTGATASCALFVVSSLLGHFGVHALTPWSAVGQINTACRVR
jgi:hypothetical protein